MALVHGLAFLMMVVIAYGVNFVVAMHKPEEQTFGHGAFHGAMMALIYALPVIAIHYLYQRKSLKLFLIDGGYVVALFALIGAVVAVLNLG